MNNEKLNVQSIFLSIDGEANGFDGAGQLCTFIRLKGCNLLCSYCDTKYAQHSDPLNLMTVDEVIKELFYTKKITITGGEPLLQKLVVEELCSTLILKYKSYISIETNGSIIPEYFYDNLRYVVDYKLPSSGVEDKMNLEVFNSLRKIDIIKFVISDWNDYNRAIELINNNSSWGARKVFSPAIDYRIVSFGGCIHILQVDPVWPQRLAEKMIEDKVDAQFSLQIHKVLWPGAKEER